MLLIASEKGGLEVRRWLNANTPSKKLVAPYPPRTTNFGHHLESEPKTRHDLGPVGVVAGALGHTIGTRNCAVGNTWPGVFNGPTVDHICSLVVLLVPGLVIFVAKAEIER